MFTVVIGNKVLGNRHIVKCASVEECQQALADYIHYHSISGGYEYGYDDEGVIKNGRKKVGRLSYNCRLWDIDDNHLLKEFTGEWRYVKTSFTGHDEDYM